VMQAWGTIVDPSLTYDSLKDLGSKPSSRQSFRKLLRGFFMRSPSLPAVLGNFFGGGFVLG